MTFNPNLLMNMLAGGSQSLVQGKQMMTGINPITQQSIASQSYAGLLQKLLGGGGKMTIDKDNFSISGSPDLLVDGEAKAFPGARTQQGNVNFESTPGGAPGGSPNTPGNPAPDGNFGANQFGANGGGNLGFLQQLLNPQQPRLAV